MSAIANTEGIPVNSSPISYDELPYGFVGGMQQRFRQKLYNPQTDPNATADLTSLRESWDDDGVTTVFTTGVYDLLHLDHSGYLLHTKAAGAAIHYANNHFRKPWDSLTPAKQQAYTRQALSQGELRLIVSVDGDRSVATRKGFNPEKGGAVRPLYAWETRALMVAGQTFIDPEDVSGERILPIADAVTIHGPQDFDPETIHATHFELASELQPDVWTIFAESTDIIEEAPNYPGLGSIVLRCIRDGVGTHYYEDPFIGKMSTTKITQRILGTL